MTKSAQDGRIGFGRRTFMLGSAAGALLLARGASAQQVGGGVLLKGGRIVGADGQLVMADLRIAGTDIAEIGENLTSGSDEVLEMDGAMLMPGLVDTHWHMWNTIARGLGQTDLGGFAKSMAPLAAAWTPEASALSVRLAVAEALESGITTVNNWAHNTKGVEFAEAELQAMRDTGIRGRFSYGYPQSLKPDEKMDFAALERFRDSRFADDDGLVHLGLCTRGPDRSDPAIWQEEWQRARALGLPLTSHVASDRKGGAAGNLRIMAEGGYLGPDVQIVHATHATDDDLRLIAQAGSTISISPWTEMEVGYGIPPIARMADAGVEIGLSVDNMVLGGNANMFAVMKVTSDLAAGQTETQGKVPDAKVLEWGTIGGARSLGLGDTVGRLATGMRADVIAVRLDAINTAPVASPQFLLMHSAHPGNVDTVIANGVIRKRGGQLTDLDRGTILEEAEKAIADLKQKAGISTL